MMPQEEKKHKRRVHYSGKYPKKFEEKYKEHQPGKYQDMIEHVIRKGNTPVSYTHLDVYKRQKSFRRRMSVM